jgi:hypothetical protein
MEMNSLRGYLQLASGMAETTKDKVRHAGKAVVVYTERVVTAVGGGTPDDVVALQQRVDALERQISELRDPKRSTRADGTKKSATAKKTTPKAPATKSAAKQAAEEESAVESPPAQP